MATTFNRMSIAVLLAAAFFATNSTAEARKKAPSPVEIQFAGIEKIVVLPAVDLRNGEKHSVKLANIQKQVLNILKKKNYAVEAAASLPDAGEPVEDDLREARPDWVRTLGPAEARWIMVVSLDDVASRMTFGSTGNAELSGYLYDKQEGTLVWQNKGIGQTGQGGLAGMMLKGTMKGQALSIATGNLMRNVPKRPKVKK